MKYRQKGYRDDEYAQDRRQEKYEKPPDLGNREQIRSLPARDRPRDHRRHPVRKMRTSSAREPARCRSPDEVLEVRNASSLLPSLQELRPRRSLRVSRAGRRAHFRQVGRERLQLVQAGAGARRHRPESEYRRRRAERLPQSIQELTRQGPRGARSRELSLPSSRIDAVLERALVPEGEFLMGRAGVRDNEEPVHRVYISSFEMAVTPVTNEQYRLYLSATAAEPPQFLDDPDFAHPDQPVVAVSFEEAAAYCRWLSRESGREIPASDRGRAREGVPRRDRRRGLSLG